MLELTCIEHGKSEILSSDMTGNQLMLSSGCFLIRFICKTFDITGLNSQVRCVSTNHRKVCEDESTNERHYSDSRFFCSLFRCFFYTIPYIKATVHCKWTLCVHWSFCICRLWASVLSTPYRPPTLLTAHLTKLSVGTDSRYAIVQTLSHPPSALSINPAYAEALLGFGVLEPHG